MYRACSESQRRACCWWLPGGSSGHTRCSAGLCSRLPWRKHQWLSSKPVKDSALLRTHKAWLQSSGIEGEQVNTFYFRAYKTIWITWDQWFSVSPCKGDQWTWQTRPQRETLGWECGWTGAHSASPGSEHDETNNFHHHTTFTND